MLIINRNRHDLKLPEVSPDWMADEESRKERKLNKFLTKKVIFPNQEKLLYKNKQQELKLYFAQTAMEIAA